MHNIFIMTPSRAVHSRINPCSAVFNEKLKSHEVAVLCVIDYALVVLALYVIRKCYVI